MVYVCYRVMCFLLVPTQETQSLYNGADLASESGTQLHTRGMKTSRLDTRKNSNHVPAPFSAGPAVAPSGDGHNSAQASLKHIHIRPGGGALAPIPFPWQGRAPNRPSVRWDLKRCCTRVFAVFFLFCPIIPLPDPTSAMWWTSLFLANYIGEALRWYHLSSHPLVSLLSKQTKSSFFTNYHKEVPRGHPSFKQGSQDLHLNNGLDVPGHRESLGMYIASHLIMAALSSLFA